MHASVIIIYSLEHVRAALRAAQAEASALGGHHSSAGRLILRSAPDMVFYGGAGYLKELERRARGEFPGVEWHLALDCAEDAGIALRALRAGHREIIFSGKPEVAEKLSDIARKQGATLRHEKAAAARPKASDALDLLDSCDPDRACLEWLRRKP